MPNRRISQPGDREASPVWGYQSRIASSAGERHTRLGRLNWWHWQRRGCRRGRSSRRILLDDRSRSALVIVNDYQQHARHHERSRENCCRPSQEIGRRTPRHETRHATAAHAEGTTLALLQQDDADEGDRDQDVHSEEQNDHGELSIALYRRIRTTRTGSNAAPGNGPKIFGVEAGAADERAV